jgi:hypothetical protein
VSCSELFLIGRLRNKPGEERSVFDEWLPSGSIPIHVFRRGHSGTGLSAKENYHSVGFGRDEAKEEDIFGSAVIAFKDSVAERAARMELHFLVPCSYQVVDDV